MGDMDYTNSDISERTAVSGNILLLDMWQGEGMEGQGKLRSEPRMCERTDRHGHGTV